jgi:hypothetical protein
MLVGLGLSAAGCASTADVESLQATIGRLQQEVKTARQQSEASAKAAAEAQKQAQSAEQQASVAAKAATSAAERADRVYQQFLERR